MGNNIVPLESILLNKSLEPPVINFPQAKLLSKIYPTPFLVLSPSRVINSMNTFREHLPGVKIFYAMKSNPNTALLRIIKNLVDGIDVASCGELSICQEVGVSSDNIIHTNPIKRESDIENSVKGGIKWFVFDNMEEINKLKRLAPNANLLLRIAINNPHCVVNLSSKFGASENDILPLLKRARSEGLNVRGIAFHVGSQCTEPNIYHTAVKYARKIFDEAHAVGFTLDTLDVGGGFPISYKYPLPPLSHFCTVLRNSLREFFPHDMNIIAEPGRSISGRCITLVTRVIGRTERNDTSWYYIDDGVYGSFSGIMFDHCDYRLVSNRSGSLEESVVAGPSCDSIDIVARDQKLPRLAVGDLLLVPGMGAYTSASATSFNGFAPPQTIVVHNEKQVIRAIAFREVMNS
ncbi:MAG: type III PLP-dependent enzyme [Syntrophales bacterium]|jgi:ornithine decarboxylase